MGIIKNQKLGTWAYALVTILAIVSLVIYVSNVNTPYYGDMNASVVVMMVVALVSLCATLVLPNVGNNVAIKVVVDLARVLAAGMIILAGATFIGMRVESFGYIYGSNLELGNQMAFDAGGQAITGIVVFVVTWILSLIASFLEVGKKA